MADNVLPPILDVNVVSPNPLPAAITNLQRMAFGALDVESSTPVVQIMAVYGSKSKVFEFSSLGGETLINNSLFKARTDAVVGSTATIVSDEYVTYRPGQGMSCLFTAQFGTPAIGNVQLAGLISSTDAFGFGYAGDIFAIDHSHDGVVEIQELTVTTPAGGAENATVTVDGIAYIVPLTAGTVEHNAAEIASSLNTQAPDYTVTSNQAVVSAVALFARPGLLFAFTSATAVASWVQSSAGVTLTDDIIPQSMWNRDTVSWLDTSKLNVFKVQFPYLGAGPPEFFVMDPVTGSFILVHVIEYPNTSDLPSVTNPSFQCGWYTQNVTNNTAIEISGSSVAAFVQGKIVITEEPRALAATNLSLGQLQTNLLTLRGRSFIDGKQNRAVTNILLCSSFTESTKAASIEVRKNATFAGAEMIYSYVDKESSTTEFATDSSLVTGGQLITASVVTTSGEKLELDRLLTHLHPNETVTFSMAQFGAPATAASLAVTFVEDL